MSDAQTKDADDGGDDELDIEVVPSELDVCTWTNDLDEKRRAFVVSQMADPDVDGKVMVQNMHAVCEWLKSGQLPAETVKKSIRVA
jgi:hypothetical protein